MKITIKLLAAIMLVSLLQISTSAAQIKAGQTNIVVTGQNPIHYRNVMVGNLKIFYREAGDPRSPTILLLHGYPTSSHMFRNLIPILKEKYHVIAPDLPGFGFSDAPEHTHFDYTFDNLAGTMQQFIDILKMKRFAVYIFDYGSPVGLRLAMANPEKVTGIISQNGNAYEEGLSKEWDPIQKYWRDPSQVNRVALNDFVSEKATWFQYHQGVKDTSLISPEAYTLDQHFLDRKGNIEIQLDLVKDYRTNVALYPKFHAYFRKYQPKALLVWGKNDPFFLPAGATAYLKDLPKAKLKFYDTGHFALETHVEEIGAEILAFLETLPL